MQALGAADYSAIASEYHTVFIENIPVFDIDLRNEMRRFITLIDELYQAKIRVICLAATPPSELLDNSGREGPYDEIFAFERCISRLVEMQSKEYRTSFDLKIKQKDASLKA